MVTLQTPTACCSFCLGSCRRLKYKILGLLQQSPLLAQPSQFFHLGARELSPPSWEHSSGKGQGSCHVWTSLDCYRSTGSFYICAFIPLRPSTAAARSMFCRISKDWGGLPGEEGKRGKPSRSRERYFTTRIVSYWSIRGEGECRGGYLSRNDQTVQWTGSNPAQDKDWNHRFYFVLRTEEDFFRYVKCDRWKTWQCHFDSVLPRVGSKKKGKLHLCLLTGKRTWPLLQDRRWQKARESGPYPVPPISQWIPCCIKLCWVQNGSATSQSQKSCACPRAFRLCCP